MDATLGQPTMDQRRGALPAAPAAAQALRVMVAGPLLALEAPGGGEVQLHATIAALRRGGVDARPWRPWEESLAGADCLHLFGSSPGHLALVAAARRRGLPVALSTIAWFGLAQYWRERRPAWRRLAACGMYLARRTCPRLPSWRRQLYQAVDLLLPNSQAEAEQLIRLFGVPATKIHNVPNGADERFAVGDPELFAARYGVRDFILYAGRIEPRKNQLGFLEALRGSGRPIVVLGDVVPGHEDYLRRCRAAADGNVLFIGRLGHDDPLLAGAYAAAACLALASWYETPGLVALEAGMSGTPLVLPAVGCAREYFGPLAEYVLPNDPAGIRRAVRSAIDRGRSAALARHVRQNFAWSAAATATADGYRRIIASLGSTRQR